VRCNKEALTERVLGVFPPKLAATSHGDGATDGLLEAELPFARTQKGAAAAKRSGSGIASSHLKFRKERIADADLGESFCAQLAGVTGAAWHSIRPGLVATASDGVVNSKIEPHLNDLRFGQIYQWGVDLQPLGALYSRFRG
jgi:hypothetical protein